MKYLSNDHENCPNQHKNSHKWWNGASHCEFDGKSIETETTTWSEFPKRRKANIEQMLMTEERNNSKRAGLWQESGKES